MFMISRIMHASAVTQNTQKQENYRANTTPGSTYLP